MFRDDVIIYTLGYQTSGVTPSKLRAFAEAQNAVVVDIRYAARSRKGEWDGHALSRTLAERYVYVHEFGNRNYKGALGSEAGIVLVNESQGVHQVLPILAQQPIILLCACWDVATCHRRIVASALSSVTHQRVIHLSPSDFRPKPTEVQTELL